MHEAIFMPVAAWEMDFILTVLFYKQAMFFIQQIT